MGAVSGGRWDRRHNGYLEIVMSTLVRLVVVLLTAALLSAFGGASYAAENVATDPEGDVLRNDGAEKTLEPENKTADITEAVTRHKAAQVHVRVRYRNLKKLPDQYLYLGIRTKKRAFFLTVRYNDGKRTRKLTSASGDVVKCKGMSATTSFADDVVTYVVPRRCLGKPVWVRTAIGHAVYQDGDALIDDARRNGRFNTKQGPKLGPKVRKG